MDITTRWTRTTRAATVLLALVLALVGALGVAAPAGAAGGSCRGYVKAAHDIRWSPFAGHRVVLDFTACGYRPVGLIGPVPYGLRGMTRPVLALQNRIPFAGGETLRLSTPVYHYSTTSRTFKYRWVLVQGHVATPRLFQNWHMELQVRRRASPIARICFVGRSCSAWQN
jgi:hypothetical protein